MKLERLQIASAVAALERGVARGDLRSLAAQTGLDQDLAAAAIRGARERSPRHLADALTAAAAYDSGCRVAVTTDTAFMTDLVPVEQLR